MRVVRDTPRAVGLAGIGLLAAGAGTAMLLDQPHQGGQLFLGICFAAVGVLALLAARQGVRVEETGLRLRYVIRSRFLPWEDVVCFKVAATRNLFGERLAKPSVLLRTGDPVPLPGANRFSFLQRNAHSSRFPVIDRLEDQRRDKIGSNRHGKPTPRM